MPIHDPARVAKLADAVDLGSEGAQPDQAEPPSTSGKPDPSRPEITRVETVVGQSRGNHEPADAVEVALAKALGEASAAGRFDVVAQLAQELEARRVARSASNVVPLDARRRGGRS
jgi:hypothetical protein